ncbi:MAG: hypothetical protein DRQ51_05315 [Gammaproteobacteria bacterium]|nr:MAG: hypothetical protein DRQ51_05315 [Gammaproteobacteria bacterium]
MTVKQDGEFVLSLVKDFFKQKDIVEKLKLFNNLKEEDDRIRGWETWWQVEFALYLDRHKKVAEWGRECSYDCDKRKTDKNSATIDFWLRKKNCDTSSFIGIEFKQAWSFSKTIREMLNDIDKICAIRDSDDDLRSLWNVGVYLKDIQHKTKNLSNKEKIDYLKDNSGEYELTESCIDLFDIKGTEFKVVFF